MQWVWKATHNSDFFGIPAAGKTTVTRLLQRLSPNYQGQILIDGVELRDYDLEYLRHCLGVVRVELARHEAGGGLGLQLGLADALLDGIWSTYRDR